MANEGLIECYTCHALRPMAELRWQERPAMFVPICGKCRKAAKAAKAAKEAVNA